MCKVYMAFSLQRIIVHTSKASRVWVSEFMCKYASGLANVLMKGNTLFNP